MKAEFTNMKRANALLAAGAVLFVVAGAVRAHGGIYPGPGGHGTGGGFAPIGSGTPTGSTPGGVGGRPPGSSTPGTGNPGGVTGGAPPRPGTPSGATPPGVGAANGSGGATKKATDTSLSWNVWWRMNDDQYLNLRSHLTRIDRQTSSADEIAGEVLASGDVSRTMGAAMQREVRAALLEALKDPYFDVRAAAVVALGKVATDGVDKDLVAMLKDPTLQVQESTCLGLGLVGQRSAVPLLIDIMRNDAKTRRDVAGMTKDFLARTRAFAALGIGLIGARTDIADTGAIEALLAQARAKEADDEVAVGAVVALGVMRAQSAVPGLIDLLNAEEASPLLRSYAATSLGKIKDRSALRALARTLVSKHTNLVESSAIALGLVATPVDSDVLKALETVVRSGAQAAARNFAVIALGEIGGVENRNLLLKMLDEPNVAIRTFAAIGLGVYFAKHDDKASFAPVGSRLLADFQQARNTDVRGADAIALGLMRYEPAGRPLLAALEQESSAAVRGHLCTALGLIGLKDAIATIRDVVKERTDVEVRQDAAIALGLLGDASAAELLRSEIELAEQNLTVRAAVSKGLGFIGDIRVVPTLRKMALPPESSDITRAFAVVALGLLGDKDSLPLLARIAENNNYQASTPGIREVVTIL